MRWFLFTIVFLYSMSITCLGCAHYSRGPWVGKIVDAETKQAIAGVGVLAVWKQDYTVPPGGGTAFVDAVEAITDQNGVFKIPAKSYFATLPEGKIYGPLFTIYKPSYKVFKYGEGGFVVNDREWHVYPKDWKGRFEKPNAVVELLKTTTREDRIKSLNGAEDVMDIPKAKIPNLMKLINAENIYLGFQPYK